MAQEENLKQLLFKDLCGRLPYGVVVHNEEEGYEGHLNSIDHTIFGIALGVNITAMCRVDFQLDTCKPYLRPLLSMTEEEKEEIRQRFCYDWEESVVELMYYSIEIRDADYFIDWLNEHHFDYRGLIEKGLALEAPEGMYKN